MSYHIVQVYFIFVNLFNKSQHQITTNKVSFNSRTGLTEVDYLSKVEIQKICSLPMAVNRSNRNELNS
jgi:hypothetical protein